MPNNKESSNKFCVSRYSELALLFFICSIHSTATFLNKDLSDYPNGDIINGDIIRSMEILRKSIWNYLEFFCEMALQQQ